MTALDRPDRCELFDELPAGACTHCDGHGYTGRYSSSPEFNEADTCEWCEGTGLALVILVGPPMSPAEFEADSRAYVHDVSRDHPDKPCREHTFTVPFPDRWSTMSEPRIEHVYIVAEVPVGDVPASLILNPGEQAVWVEYAEGGPVELFRYYVDELRFTAAEFIGLTEDEARALHHRRDVEWLRS